ncbi:hypothetical protein ACIPD2_38400 [Streptomyces griseofuscus]|uniref:hypothetical protein n=1 Tax=Streptomyces griseofuscus TaxID=146922 RepID=UPI003823AFAD
MSTSASAVPDRLERPEGVLGLVGGAEHRVEFAQREAQAALCDQVTPVTVGALERDRPRAGP